MRTILKTIRMLKKLAGALVLGISLAVGGGAAAHTAKPKHGGVVRAASDLSFELVTRGDGATLYVEDHGKPLATAGMAGKLTVQNAAGSAEAELKPAGGNRLEAKGLELAKGARAVAVLTLPRKSKPITVRFTVK